MSNSEDQARAQYEHILELIKDNRQSEIEQAPLSIEIRSGWTLPGQKMEPAEFKILLCWGGPSVQIIGELDQFQRPIAARLQFQDWFEPWSDWREADEQKLIEFCDYFLYDD